MTTICAENLSKRVKEIYRGSDIIRTVKRITTKTVSKERLIMKNNDKIFDGDKIYAMAVTLFAGVCSVGFVLTAAIQKFF